MKPIQLLLLLPIFLSCNSNQSIKTTNSEKLGLDTIALTYFVTAEDISMNSTISEAKKTIGEFDQALKSTNPSYSNFAVKKRYKTADGGGEHMWIAGITIINGNYKGFVNNDADKTMEIKYGDTVIVRRDEITDWMYLDNNILKGGYTIRKIRNQMNKEDRIKLDKHLGFKIKD